MTATLTATYTAEGDLSVQGNDSARHDIGHFDADGGEWMDAVDALLRDAGYERTGDWDGDDASVREIS